MKEFNFQPFPVLQSKRLSFRQLNESDDALIFFLRTDEGVNRFINRQPTTHLEEARAFIKRINDGIAENKSLYWVICLKNNPDLIGTICLWNFSEDKTTAEIGYELLPDFQGKGYMNEAIATILEFGKNILDLKIIEAYTHRDHIASKRLLEKHSFKLDPRRKDPDNNYNCIYSLHF